MNQGSGGRFLLKGAWAALFCLPIPCGAQVLSTTDFSMSSYALDGGGDSSVAASYSQTSSVGQIIQTTGTATSFAARAGLMSIDFYPGTVSSFTVSAVDSQGNATVSWTAPGDDGYAAGTSARDYIIKYSSSLALSPASSDQNFDNASTIASLVPSPQTEGTQQSVVVSGLKAGTVYYFAMKSQEADGLYSPLSAGATTSFDPMGPLDVGISSDATSVTITWAQVQYFSDGTPFSGTAGCPGTACVSSYHVMRASITNASDPRPVGVNWVDISGAVSTSTALSFTDTSGGPAYYYAVESVNDHGTSTSTIIRAAGTFDGWVVAYDGQSTLDIPAAAMPALGNYAFVSEPLESQVGNGTFKAASFTPLQGGLVADSTLQFNPPATLSLHYTTSTASSGQVTYDAVSSSQTSTLSLKPESASPQTLLAWWYNNGSVNNGWIPVQGSVNTGNQVYTATVGYLGQYQLRGGATPQDLAFDPGRDVSPREITPFGETNRYSCIVVENNTQGASMSAEIFDLRGALVSDLSEIAAGTTSPYDCTGVGGCGESPNTCFAWDGTAHGHTVPGGVYLYMVKGGGHTYTGTLVVIR